MSTSGTPFPVFRPRDFVAGKRAAFASGQGAPGLASTRIEDSRAGRSKVGAASRPSTGFIVSSGAAAMAPAEDEERRRRSGGAGGAGGGRSGSRAGSGRYPGGGALAVRAQPSHARSSIEKTRALASGSQASVIKLASFASGRSQMGALVRYQSRDGEIPLEREDGTKVEGTVALEALVAQWTQETIGPEPSKDVLFVTVTVLEPRMLEAVQAALGVTLAGHRYAWRVEESERQTKIHVVTSAASRQGDETGRPRRIFDNKKSIGALHDRLEVAFGSDAQLDERGWAHGTEGAARYLLRLTGDGRKPATSSTGRILDSREDALEVAASWKRDLRSREPRDTAHIILSAKAGTPRESFVDAARATLAREFAGHKYAFALHTDKRHVHVHAIVRMDSIKDERLHPNIADFQRWRETLAEEARHRHIPMEELRRFEQANSPAYKLKDVSMAERGEATKAQHDRLQAAGRTWNNAKGLWEETERDVHIPSRGEGRRRANDSAHQWRALREARPVFSEPPLSSGAIRLYRSENAPGRQRAAPLFTIDRAKAESMATSRNATLSYVDVPESRRGEIRPSRSDPINVFVVSAELLAERRDIARQTDDTIIVRAMERATRAAIQGGGSEIARLGRQLGDSAMRTAENLSATRASLEALFNEALPHLPEGDRADWSKQKNDMLAATDKLIATNRRMEANRGSLHGETFEKPQALDVGTAFTPELKAGEVHYSRRNAATDKFEVAFVDRGSRVDIQDWTNRESVLAAMTLSAQKWDTISVTGSDSYRTMVVALAVEHGFVISNPDLQEKITVEQQRVLRQREQAAPTAQGISPGGAGAETSPNPKAESGAAAPSPPVPTPGETQIVLDQIRQQTEREAGLEARQALEARRLGETTPASGTVEHPYRSGQEARAAGDAARSMENNPNRPTPAEPGQSKKIQALAREQKSYLEQARAFNEAEAARNQAEKKTDGEER